MLTKEQEKKINIDLGIIVAVSLAMLGIYIVFNQQINSVVYNQNINIVLRVLFVGGLFQFGLAGLGISIVCIIRKESFLDYGLRLKGILPAILFSALCCLPSFLYRLSAGNIHGWLPFSGVNTTREVLASGFPFNVLGILVTAICWGFFEGFNYVVISEKINKLLPTKNKFLNWGAIICAIMCIFIHGVIGITPDAIIEMLCTMALIYGMLVVKDITGNAWGCVLIFMLFWNAL